MVITEKPGRASAKTISLVNAEQEQFFSLMLNKQLALPSLIKIRIYSRKQLAQLLHNLKQRKKKEKTGYMSR